MRADFLPDVTRLYQGVAYRRTLFWREASSKTIAFMATSVSGTETIVQRRVATPKGGSQQESPEKTRDDSSSTTGCLPRRFRRGSDRPKSRRPPCTLPHSPFLKCLLCLLTSVDYFTFPPFPFPATVPSPFFSLALPLTSSPMPPMCVSISLPPLHMFVCVYVPPSSILSCLCLTYVYLPANKWLQQQIPACRPVFTAKYVFGLFIIVGILFLILGIVFVAATVGVSY